MKGLLLKDVYMMAKYCRAYLLIAILFIAISFAGNDNMFLVFYPCIMCGIIPVNLLGYDERSRWLSYSETMPYTKAQIVSAKYLIGLGAQMVMMIITGGAQAIRMIIQGEGQIETFMVMLMLLLIISLMSSAISLPFMFKLGVEKGRMAYYIMVGVVCAGSVISSRLLSDGIQTEINSNGILPLLCLVIIVLYALSWYLSIVFYKKREL